MIVNSFTWFINTASQPFSFNPRPQSSPITWRLMCIVQIIPWHSHSGFYQGLNYIDYTDYIDWKLTRLGVSSRHVGRVDTEKVVPWEKFHKLQHLIMS